MKERFFGSNHLSHKYGEDEEGWRSRAMSEKYGVGLWKTIKNEW